MSYRYVSVVTPNTGMELVFSKVKKVYSCIIRYKEEEFVHSNTSRVKLNEDIEYTFSKIYKMNDVFVHDFFKDELLETDKLEAEEIYPIPRSVRVLFINFEW